MLPTCRIGLRLAITRPILRARLSTGPEFIDQIDDTVPLEPPTAGPSGHPPAANVPTKGSKANPITEKVPDLNIPIFRLHCQSTNNNTMTTFSDEQGNVQAIFSGGKVGFKHSGRSSYEAGYQCAVRIFRAIELYRKQKSLTFNIALFFNGFGQGRDAMQKALMTVEGERIRNSIVSITDRTPIKVGGTRAKKMRRG